MNQPGNKPVVGIVGGIGSGKSAVAEILAEYGGRIIDADRLGHAALEQPAIKDQIVARWGREILDEQGAIVRRKLGQIVFARLEDRQELERIVHPWIGQRIKDEIAQAQADPEVEFVILDAAILLEAGWSRACDRLLFVDVPREQRLARLQASRSWSASELDAREAAQWPLAEKIARADFTVPNTGSREDLQKRIEELLKMGLLQANPATAE